MNALNTAVEIAGSTHRLEITVGCEKRLNVIIARRKIVQALNRECRSCLVEGCNDARSKILNVASDNRRCLRAGIANCISRLRTI